MSVKPLVIVPARVGSKGVPNKNFRTLPDGSTLVSRAVAIGVQLGRVVVTTDAPWQNEHRYGIVDPGHSFERYWHQRPAALAQDDTPMSAVVEDVLAQYPGPPEQLVVLLQPTVPLRQLSIVQQAIESADKHPPVATVSEVPHRYRRSVYAGSSIQFYLPEQRQCYAPLYILTGDAYVFVRGFGWPKYWRGLVVPESLNIDTTDDWAELERLLTTKP